MTRRLFVFFIALLPLQACSTQYSADPITAYVVDAESGKPIEGAIVVAHWQLYGGLHPDRAGELTIMETTTDKGGRFHFPAWGPKPVPDGLPSNARLAHLDPEILIFKNGFKYERVSNELTMAALRGEKPPHRQSDWNGKSIKLSRVSGELRERLRNLNNLTTSLQFAINDPKRCEWRQVQLIIRESWRERLVLEELGAELIFRTLDEQIDGSAAYFEKHGCSLTKEWLKETLK